MGRQHILVFFIILQFLPFSIDAFEGETHVRVNPEVSTTHKYSGELTDNIYDSIPSKMGYRSSLSVSRASWIAPVFSISYNAFTYTNSAWQEEYDNIPVKIDSIIVFSGVGGAFGLWFKRLLYTQIEMSYFFKQKQRAKISDNRRYVDAEGISWNLTSSLTIPVASYVSLELGGGYSGHHYRIGFGGEDELAITRNYFGLLGCRIVGESVSLYLNTHFLVNQVAVRGYHLRTGIAIHR